MAKYTAYQLYKRGVLINPNPFEKLLFARYANANYAEQKYLTNEYPQYFTNKVMGR